MKKTLLALAVVAIGFASCGEPAPKVGDRKNGMAFGKGFSGNYEWMPEEDYDRFFSEEARARGARKLRQMNYEFDEMARKMRVSENAERILSGRDPLPYYH